MRLLDTLTGQFLEIPSHDKLPYAILSHTWDAGGEQTYQDVLQLQRAWLPTWGTKSVAIWGLYHFWRIFLLLISLILRDLHFALQRGHLTNSPHLRLPETQRMNSAKQLSLWAKLVEGMAQDVHAHLSYLHGTLVSKKIRESCAVALADGYQYIWIDSCCIDKSSSSELSEAINSMFKWYSGASVCYAFLGDVPDGGNLYAADSAFRRSRWFTRGWTLQELIAPRIVVFYSSGWQVLGTKFTLAHVLAPLTGIQKSILSFEASLSSVSVAARMSWAAKRQTTRVEDQAYSLLGIFDINMPTLYGEGSRAFMRLQEEVLRTIPDQSIFAWGKRVPLPGEAPALSREHRARLMQATRLTNRHESWFAAFPADFADASDLRPVPQSLFLDRLYRYTPPFSNPEYVTTPYGIRTQLPCVSLQAFPDILRAIWLSHGKTTGAEEWFLVILAVETVQARRDGHLIARVCFSASPSVHSVLPILKTGYILSLSTPTMQPAWPQGLFSLSTLSTLALRHLRNHIGNKEIFLFSQYRRSFTDEEDIDPPANLEVPPLHIPGWVAAALQSSGCRLSHRIAVGRQIMILSDRNGLLAAIEVPALSGDSLYITILAQDGSESRRYPLAILEWFSTRFSARGFLHSVTLPTGQRIMVRVTLVPTSSGDPSQRVASVELYDDAWSLSSANTQITEDPDVATVTATDEGRKAVEDIYRSKAAGSSVTSDDAGSSGSAKDSPGLGEVPGNMAEDDHDLLTVSILFDWDWVLLLLVK
ncbi:hypothetical protein C8Q76DRAFT_665356 [Earliella scabrosa]|nr:hypothetical protein C8Q76DRAFT_665356 [Earliella scabrosa]